MNKRLLFILFVSIGYYCNAQYIVNGVIQDGNRPNLQGVFGEINDNDNDDIEGSPYINDEFLPAKISVDDKTIFAVRYNGFTDQFEVKDKSDKAFLLNKYRSDISVKLLKENKLYKSYKYINDNDLETLGYFVVLTDDSSNIVLLSKEVVKFVEGKTSVTSYQDDKPAKYRRNNDQSYVKIGEKPAVELPNNKKHLAKLFPEHSKEILSFIKSNKIKTSKDEDLIQLIKYINTL